MVFDNKTRRTSQRVAYVVEQVPILELPRQILTKRNIELLADGAVFACMLLLLTCLRACLLACFFLFFFLESLVVGRLPVKT